MNKSIFSNFQINDVKTGKPLDLLESMKVMFDLASENQTTLFEQTYVDRWFHIHPKQMGLTVEGILATYNVRARAALIGDDSMTPVRPIRGFEPWKGEIPRFGHRFTMNAKVLRRVMQLYENSRANSKTDLDEVRNTVFGHYRDAYLGCKDAVDEIILQALSKGGVALFDPLSNNPEGRRFMVDYDMPGQNKRFASVEWTAANISNPSIDVLGELIKVVYDYRALGIEFGEMLMAPDIRYWLLQSMSIRRAVLGENHATRIVREDELDAILRSSGLPPVRVINKRVGVQKDGVVKPENPWDDDVIAFLPRTRDGRIGEVQPAVEDSRIIPDPNVNYAETQEGIVIAKWSEGESTGQSPAEYTQGTWRAMPVLTTIRAIVNFKVRNISVPYPTGEEIPVG
jgi:hypothetical protein